jgi:hypothetical protein
MQLKPAHSPLEGEITSAKIVLHRHNRPTGRDAMKILYTTQATATGGRTGHAKTADGILDIDLVTPKELGGQGNPPGGKLEMRS